MSVYFMLKFKNINFYREKLAQSKLLNSILIAIIAIIAVVLLGSFIVKKCQSKKAPEYLLEQ